MIETPELREMDELLTELSAVEVTPPNWAAVVDVLAQPARPVRRIAVGWSAIIVGAVIAMAVGVAGAVSEPVRTAVFEPVANLLPWVDGPAPVETPPAEPVESDEPSVPDGQVTGSIPQPTRTTDTVGRDPEPERRPDPAEDDTGDRTREELIDERPGGRESDARDNEPSPTTTVEGRTDEGDPSAPTRPGDDEARDEAGQDEVPADGADEVTRGEDSGSSAERR